MTRIYIPRLLGSVLCLAVVIAVAIAGHIIDPHGWEQALLISVDVVAVLLMLLSSWSTFGIGEFENTSGPDAATPDPKEEP